MTYKYLVLVSLISLSSCTLTAQTPAESATASKPSTEVKVFEADNGWGYDIYVNGKKYIHQATIPSVPGTLGFVSEKEALKVGEFVKGKIDRNEMPPSVTPENLTHLKIEVRETHKIRSD